MRRAIDTPDLWQSLVAGIKPPPSIAEIADRHLSVYRRIGLQGDTIRLKAHAA
jgi:hypothetical protein